MSGSDPGVQPALSRSEWEFATKHGLRRSDSVFENRNTGVGECPPETAHYIAALALYQQPFGFAGQDVSGLRSAAAEWERAGDLRHLWATWLADRIEALLPPEEK